MGFQIACGCRALIVVGLRLPDPRGRFSALPRVTGWGTYPRIGVRISSGTPPWGRAGKDLLFRPPTVPPGALAGQWMVFRTSPRGTPEILTVGRVRFNGGLLEG